MNPSKHEAIVHELRELFAAYGFQRLFKAGAEEYPSVAIRLPKEPFAPPPPPGSVDAVSVRQQKYRKLMHSLGEIVSHDEYSPYVSTQRDDITPGMIRYVRDQIKPQLIEAMQEEPVSAGLPGTPLNDSFRR